MKKAIAQYQAARAAHIAAKNAEEAARDVYRKIPRASIRDNLEIGRAHV